jgi:hypothetical protein
MSKQHGDATQCSCHHIPDDSNLQKVRFFNLTLKQHVLEIILNYSITDIPGIMWYYIKYVDKMQSTEC